MVQKKLLGSWRFSRKYVIATWGPSTGPGEALEFFWFIRQNNHDATRELRARYSCKTLSFVAAFQIFCNSPVLPYDWLENPSACIKKS